MVANYVVFSNATDNLASLDGIQELANLLGLNISTAMVVELHDADLEPALLRLIQARGLSYFTHYVAPVDPGNLEKAREDLARSGMWIDHVNCRSSIDGAKIQGGVDMAGPESDQTVLIGVRVNPDGPVHVKDIPEKAYGGGESASVIEDGSASVTTSDLPAWLPPRSVGDKACKICGQPVIGRKKICGRTECKKAQVREYNARWTAKKAVESGAEPKSAIKQLPADYEVISGPHKGERHKIAKFKELLGVGRYDVGTWVKKLRGYKSGEYQVIKRAGHFSMAFSEVE